MVLTYSQQVNPIRSQVWCPFREQHTELGTKVTNSYGSYSRYLQVGDGSTASTFPEMIGSKGFRFTGSQYLGFVGSSLTLGDSWSICMMIRPKLYISDGYLVGFSNGGGIVAKNSGESDELTYNDGATTISSGIELSKDRFYSIIIAKDSSNNVTFYINGEEEGSGIGTNSGFDLDYIGCDGSLGNFYEGELREFCVFDFELAPIQASILDNRFIRVIEGQEFYWTPGDILGSLGAWFDFRTDSRGTYNTQSDNTNSDFASWTGTYPDEHPAGWSKSPDPGVVTAHVADAGNACRLVSDGTYVRIDRPAGAVIGNRYSMSCDVLDLTTGDIRVTGDELPGAGGVGVYAGDFTALYTLSTGLRRVGATDATFTNLVFRNLSLTQFDPQAATGALAGSALVQASDAAMPWYRDTYGVYFDDADRYAEIGDTSSAEFLHDGSGGTLALRWYQHAWATSGNHVQIVGTTSQLAAYEETGVSIYSRPDNPGGFRAYLGDGSTSPQALADGSAGGFIQLGWNTLILRIKTGAYSLDINGTEFSGVPTALSSGAHADKLHLSHYYVAGKGLKLSASGLLLTNSYLSDTQVANLKAYW